MGCCGCSNKSSAITAGIFGLIQAFIGLIFNAYFLNLYDSYIWNLTLDKVDERLFLLFATRDVIVPIKIVLGVAAFLHSIWIISSIVLLIGNASNNACCVRQWVIITAFVIIGDILLPVAITGLTIGSFLDVVQSIPSSVRRDNSFDSQFQQVVADVNLDLYKYYGILLFSFYKLTLITIIINICFNVFTNRRASEISNSRGYVIGTTVTIIQGQIPNVIHAAPCTSVIPVPVQGVPNPYYAGNIPLQPASNFGPPMAESPPEYLSNPIGDDQKDPLLPPGKDARC